MGSTISSETSVFIYQTKRQWFSVILYLIKELG